MPRRTDIHSIMVIGSGPIVIGQACEFDYSGTQACQVLREDGDTIELSCASVQDAVRSLNALGAMSSVLR